MDKRPCPRALIGEIMVRHGKARHDHVEFALELQAAYRKIGKSPMPKIGEILINHRACDLLKLTEALVFQESAPTESITRIVSAIKSLAICLPRSTPG